MNPHSVELGRSALLRGDEHDNSTQPCQPHLPPGFFPNVPGAPQGIWPRPVDLLPQPRREPQNPDYWIIPSWLLPTEPPFRVLPILPGGGGLLIPTRLPRSVVCNFTSKPMIVWSTGNVFIILNPGECTDSGDDLGDFYLVPPIWYKCPAGFGPCMPTDEDPTYDGWGLPPGSPGRQRERKPNWIPFDGNCSQICTIYAADRDCVTFARCFGVCAPDFVGPVPCPFDP